MLSWNAGVELQKPHTTALALTTQPQALRDMFRVCSALSSHSSPYGGSFQLHGTIEWISRRIDLTSYTFPYGSTYPLLEADGRHFDVAPGGPSTFREGIFAPVLRSPKPSKT